MHTTTRQNSTAVIACEIHFGSDTELSMCGSFPQRLTENHFLYTKFSCFKASKVTEAAKMFSHPST